MAVTETQAPIRILVIDDDALVRRMLETSLGREGFVVQTAGGGNDGLARAASDPPSLVLLDLVMAPPDGFEVIRRLRNKDPKRELPIVVLTALDDAEDLSRALDLGADDYLRKPFRDAELLARIRGQLRLRGTLDELARKERDAKAMLDLTQTLASSLDFREILFTVVRRIAEVVRVDRCSIVLAREGSDVGYVVGSSDDASVQNLTIDLTKYPEIRHVMDSREPLVIDDIRSHPLLDSVRADVARNPYTSTTLLPIVYEDKATGVLFLRATGGRAQLDDRELGFCRSAANATAVALRNARILQSLRDQTQQITFARFEAERKLRTLERYADFFMSSADGMLVVDSDGQILFVNPRAIEILGYAEQDARQMNIADLVAGDGRSRLDALRSGFGRGEAPRGLDLTFVRRDGQRRILSVSSSSLLQQEGAVLLTLRDVTEQRQTERDLQKTKEFLEKLVTNSVDAIVAADLRGNIMLFNKGAERVYGYRADEVIGKVNVESVYPPGVAREVMRRLRTPQHGGVGRLEPMRTEALSREGERIPISLSAALIYEGEHAVASFGIFTDLRERLRIEERLAQAQEKLVLTEKQAIVAELAGTAAHELNQPLTSIMAYAELLKRKLGGGSPLQPAAEVIGAEAERMAEIVRKIGKITKYETKSYVGAAQILDLDKASTSEPAGSPSESSPGREDRQ